MTRRLSRADWELWEKLRQSVRPLRPAKPVEPPPASEPEAVARREPTPGGRRTAPASTPAHQGPPPLVTLDERTRRRLGRGLADVDARIDLHGMRQERAFTALMGFLQRAQARHQKLVLVITGKGREGEEGRGVLRQSVPAWLARPEFRSLVLGFEEAGRRHGGAGALFVRLRRRREAAALRSGGSPD